MVKFRRDHRSSNVEYRGAARSGGGLGRGLPIPSGRGGKIGAGAGGLGIVGVIVVVLISVLGGGGGGGGLGTAVSSGEGSGGAAPERSAFLEVVFDDVQNHWVEVFDANNSDYPFSTMVIFSDSVVTGGCGSATAAVGPFYCPADSQVYLDPVFFNQLAERFGAPGDFAQAYVVAHEVGHHVQNVTGESDEMRRLQQSDPNNANQYSVRLELQADCLAGVWGNRAAQRSPTISDGSGNLLYLEEGDIEEGLGAAAAVGDDSIQEASLGRSDPHSYTHGTSEQRIRWFRVGFDTGDASACSDTFDLAYDSL